MPPQGKQNGSEIAKELVTAGKGTHAIVVLQYDDGTISIGLSGKAETAGPVIGIMRAVRAHLDSGVDPGIRKVHEETTVDGVPVDLYSEKGKN